MLEYVTGLSTFFALVSTGLLVAAAGKRRSYALPLLALSMLLYALGAGAEFLAALRGGWGWFHYKFYYAISPIQVALLGLGVVSLYIYRWMGGRGLQLYLAYTAVVSLLLLAAVASAELNTEALSDVFVGGRAMPDEVRRFSPLLTVPSGLFTIVVPLYYYARKEKRLHALLIPLASIVMMIAGGAIRRGQVDVFYLLEFVASVILTAAFYQVYREA